MNDEPSEVCIVTLPYTVLVCAAMYEILRIWHMASFQSCGIMLSNSDIV